MPQDPHWGSAHSCPVDAAPTPVATPRWTPRPSAPLVTGEVPMQPQPALCPPSQEFHPQTHTHTPPHTHPHTHTHTEEASDQDLWEGDG